MENRPNWDNYWMQIAANVSRRSTCNRRQYGAVLVTEDNKIISTGYNGSQTDGNNCCDIRECERERLNVPPGERYELCNAIHAEQNALLQAGDRAKGATLYLWSSDKKYIEPCKICKRMLKQAGVKTVYMLEDVEDML